MAMGAAASGSGLFKFVKHARVQSTDISAAVTWGVAATTTALWMIQPFDWIKKQFEKREN